MNKNPPLLEYLEKKGINTKVYFSPAHLSDFYKRSFGHYEGELCHTEKISKEVLSLPIYPTLTKEEINYVTGSIVDFMNSMKV